MSFLYLYLHRKQLKHDHAMTKCFDRGTASGAMFTKCPDACQ